MKKYSAGLTGAPFLYFETNKCLELKSQGLSIDEIKNKIFNENLFNYKKTSAISRTFSGIKKRIENLDDQLLNIYNEEFIETKKQIILYLICKTEPILLDFLNEIITEKIKFSDYEIKNIDFIKFLNNKAENFEEVAKWTENTKNKIISVMKKILYETNIIKDKKYTKLQKIVLNHKFEKYLEEKNEKEFLKIFLQL
jgi:hypothetical protein